MMHSEHSCAVVYPPRTAVVSLASPRVSLKKSALLWLISMPECKEEKQDRGIKDSVSEISCLDKEAIHFRSSKRYHPFLAYNG